jgi:kynureninase
VAESVVADPGLLYLDGNSLGRLTHRARRRLAAVVDGEWAEGLVRSWDTWIDLPGRVGDAIAAHLVGARPGEVVVGDSTTVNLYKAAAAAITARPRARAVVTDDDNFPTDRYVLEGLAARHGLEYREVASHPVHGADPDALVPALAGAAVLCLSHVAYRSAALADMAALTRLAHDHGALALWDLSHAAGSVPVDLTGAGADLAVGCTYKYLNGGPGAPAFTYVRRELQGQLRQPIWGWFGRVDQFGMGPGYEPEAGVGSWLTGTPSVLALACVEEGVGLLAEAGIHRLRDKGMALTSLAVDLADSWLAPHGYAVASPRDPSRRGSHVALAHPDAEKIVAGLLAAGVVTDVRAPDRLRLGPAPIATRFVDVWDALDRIRRLSE